MFANLNWIEIQDFYNQHNTLKLTCEKFKITRRTIEKAVKLNLFIKEKRTYRISDEHREKISNKMKFNHSNGKHPGWLHINSSTDKISYPERYVNTCIETIGLHNRYEIKKHLPVGKYCLDFAFIDLKVDLEIDGVQHLTEKHIIHDNLRTTYLESKGWKVYRILWTKFKLNPNYEINNFISYLNNSDLHSIRYTINDIIKPKLKTIKNVDYSEEIKQILNSGINFKKHGWVKEVSKILNKKSQRVNNWMKKYMSDFYINCYHRKKLD